MTSRSPTSQTEQQYVIALGGEKRDRTRDFQIPNHGRKLPSLTFILVPPGV